MWPLLMATLRRRPHRTARPLRAGIHLSAEIPPERGNPSMECSLAIMVADLPQSRRWPLIGTLRRGNYKIYIARLRKPQRPVIQSPAQQRLVLAATLQPLVSPRTLHSFDLTQSRSLVASYSFLTFISIDSTRPFSEYHGSSPSLRRLRCRPSLDERLYQGTPRHTRGPTRSARSQPLRVAQADGPHDRTLSRADPDVCTRKLELK